jgi:four helix bundle protein
VQHEIVVSPPYDIQERSFGFACDLIVFCRKLPRNDDVVRRLSWQLLDAGTSIGANLEEADAAQSKRDFIAKAAIARKESRESRYWLRLITFAEPRIGNDAAPLIDESTQLYKILTSIILNAESNADRG